MKKQLFSYVLAVLVLLPVVQPVHAVWGWQSASLADDTIDDQDQSSWKDTVVSIASSKKTWLGAAGLVSATVAYRSNWFFFDDPDNGHLYPPVGERDDESDDEGELVRDRSLEVNYSELTGGAFNTTCNRLCRSNLQESDVISSAQEALKNKNYDALYAHRVYAAQHEEANAQIVFMCVCDESLIDNALSSHKFELLWSLFDHLKVGQKAGAIQGAQQYLNENSGLTNLDSANQVALMNLATKNGSGGDVYANQLYTDASDKCIQDARNDWIDAVSANNIQLVLCIVNRMRLLGKAEVFGGELLNRVIDRVSFSDSNPTMTMCLIRDMQLPGLRYFMSEEFFWWYCEQLLLQCGERDIAWLTQELPYYSIEEQKIIACKVLGSQLLVNLEHGQWDNTDQRKGLMTFVILLLRGGEEAAQQKATELGELLTSLATNHGGDGWQASSGYNPGAVHDPFADNE